MPANIKQKKPISKHLMLKFIIKSPRRSALWGDFKTSYVEVYRNAPLPRTTKRRFQNILCWSLSTKKPLLIELLLYFKTSYVEVYPNINFLCLIDASYFKTSYVEVYPFCPFSIRINSVDFKTSYVEVYPRAFKIRTRNSSFQNILCWSLSFNTVVVPVHSLDFKTSYVEVYLESCGSPEWSDQNFKTSYVEVYHISLCNISFLDFISKHLMLKFISGCR